MSTSSCSASSCALRSGRTLKPMMMAFDAEASSTSVSVMAPTPDRSSLKRTLSFESLRQQIAEHFHRALHVALEDDVQFLGAGGLDLLRQAFERNARTLGQRGFAGFLLAVFGDAAGLVAIGDDDELIASLRQPFHAENFDRSRRRRRLQRCSAIVEHGANFSVNIADYEIIAGEQRAVLHQQQWPRVRGRDRVSLPEPRRWRRALEWL